MTIERNGRTILLQGNCTVEDAETLLNQLHEGANTVDMSGCTLLHTACLQVLLAANVKLTGTPGNTKLAQWVAPALLAPTEI